jgi:arylsulfatase A-like enzyme
MKAIVVIVRGLQAGALGCYGNSWVDTLAFDTLAAKGVVFDWHFAENTDPVAVHRTWRSGRYHLPRDNATAVAERVPDLLAALCEREIHTCLIVDESRSSASDFADGWNTVERVTGNTDESPLDATFEAVGAALERLEQRDNWLLWIDLATLLPPWNVPPEFQETYFSKETDEVEDKEPEEEEAEESEHLMPLTEIPVGPIECDDDAFFVRLQTSYVAAVTYVDAALSQLLEALGGLEGGDEILLAVTSDAGQNLGEHGIVGICRPWLHNELIHLPLLLRLPDVATAGQRVEALTQTVDLAPTLADWFGATLPDAHGRSLLPSARGAAEKIRSYACAGLQIGEALEYALRTPDWAFLWPVRLHDEDAGRSTQLYVKPDDRWEVNNVAQHHLEFVERLERTLRDFVATTSQPGPLQAPSLPPDELTVADAE